MYFALLRCKRYLIALTIAVLFGIISRINVAHAHSCGHGDCSYVWPNAILSSNEEIISYVSIIGISLLAAILIFKFVYLQRKDYYLVKYSPTSDRINRVLFEGRDKRKIFAAIPFLAFGGLLFVASIQMLFAYGFTEYESCQSYRMPICQTTTYANTAFIVILYSLPFIGGGAFLLVTGVRAISLVTMKKEQLCH